MTNMKKVCVLLSTYNGKLYVREQIESVLAQLNVEVFILVRDDGSTDGTQEILQEYTGKNFSWYQGDNIGPARSFLDLLSKAPVVDYYAFCDQDDIWLEEKVSRAISFLTKNHVPSFYFSNVSVVDEGLNEISKSNIQCNEKSLATLLLHNCAIGCTVVINKALKDYVIKYTPKYIYMHDWWVYKVCLAIGGYVKFDEEAKILYRQHSSNHVGFDIENVALPSLKKMKHKSTHMMCLLSEEVVKGYSNEMSKENYEICYKFSTYYKSIPKKINLLLDNRFFGDNLKQNVIDKARILFNRI